MNDFMGCRALISGKNQLQGVQIVRSTRLKRFAGIQTIDKIGLHTYLLSYPNVIIPVSSPLIGELIRSVSANSLPCIEMMY